MTIAPVIKKRIEMRMSIRELGRRSSILVGALEDAERRDSLEHFTALQLRRLGKALEMDVFSVLAESQSDPEPAVADSYDYLSDAALAFLVETARAEGATGAWSEAANSDPLPGEVAELLEAGAMSIVSGRAVVASGAATSLALVNPEPREVTRTARFSPTFAAEIRGVRS